MPVWEMPPEDASYTVSWQQASSTTWRWKISCGGHHSWHPATSRDKVRSPGGERRLRALNVSMTLLDHRIQFGQFQQAERDNPQWSLLLAIKTVVQSGESVSSAQNTRKILQFQEGEMEEALMFHFIKTRKHLFLFSFRGPDRNECHCLHIL